MPIMERFDSMKMMSSSASQYLPPDYLHPLPTTLDAKQSPLALLAQTCSSIGKDPPSKSVIPHIEKKGTPEKSTPVDNSNSNSSKSTSVMKPKDGRVSIDRHSAHSDDTKDITNFYPISTSSPKPVKSVSVDVLKTMHKDERKLHERDIKSSPVVSRPSSSTSSGVKSYTDRVSPRLKSVERSSPKEARDIRCSPPLKRQRSESPVRREHSPSYESKPTGSLYPGLPFNPYSYPGVPFGPAGFAATPESLAAAGYPFSLPGQSSYPGLASAHASALAAHHAALKQQGSSAALAQYREYVSRMKHPAGIPLTGVASACKDPYCTNCASSQCHLAAQCTSPGCAQCAQEKKLQGLSQIGLPVSSALGSQFLSPGLPSAGLSALHNLYAQSLMTQQAGHPHVCNWMSGSDYCGKRFTSSEELLQHLRTHTSGGDTSALSAYYSLGLAVPPPAELGVLPGYLQAPGSLSPESLRRMYPSGLSSLESSSAALASRYHPYKSGLSQVPSGLPVHQSLSSLGPFHSPYSVYGQRIGSAVVP